ncbi:MAG: hypothetical protein IKY09_02645 [Methanocorpusculum sp.]|nr:hypothetical protein [Methanocorpusculum sp.]MBR5451035.1 hypothetical protein [Methanocorpusculum sp.]
MQFQSLWELTEYMMRDKYLVSDAKFEEVLDKRRIYKPGEISETTGLQKQPDGSWAEPRRTQPTRQLRSEGNAVEPATKTSLTKEQKSKTKEVETRINSSGWFKNESKLDGIHPESAANIEKQCERLFNEFPAMKGFVEGIKVGTLDNKTFAMCEATGESAYIVFNDTFFSDNEKLKQSYKETVDANYHPAGTDEESLTVHEMAHCMCDFLSQKYGVDFDDFCRALVEAAEDEYRKSNTEFNIKKELGRYCTDAAACPDENIRNAELIADAYAEYKCSKTPRRLATFIGKSLEGAF